MKKCVVCDQEKEQMTTGPICQDCRDKYLPGRVLFMEATKIEGGYIIERWMIVSEAACLRKFGKLPRDNAVMLEKSLYQELYIELSKEKKS